jgi:S-DNA-T family DNA segregation ATPase FtsK/SpoIIIE
MKKVTSIFRGREVSKIDEMAEEIKNTFAEFAVPVEIIEAIDGYSSYHFHLRPLKPMRMKAFAGFLEDLKYAFSNDSVEIQAPIPNKKLVGITMQKKEKLPPIYFKDALKWEEFQEVAPLVVPLGIDEFGDKHLADIARMPHMLMGGTTGSGKSMLLHSFINALLEKNTPDTLRFLFIDPKRIELTLYAGLPHLLTPTITQAKRTIQALSWAIKEMERRYDILEAEKVQNITSYHKNIYQPAKEAWQKRGSRDSEAMSLPEALPYIVIVIDELNDIMLTYPRELESCIVRLAQMSRAVGIHMILVTQRPSMNVVTATIKANIPTRIAMMVASQVDSRTIIDITGAEKLRGSGDILYLGSDTPRPVRLQGLYISEDEIRERVKAWMKLDNHDLDTVDFESDGTSNDSVFNAMVDGEVDDELYEDAKQVVIRAGKASTSLIQRALRVGYSRSARLMDLLEENGVIGPADGSKPREVNRKYNE